ncbi:MAG: Phosphatidate cytidylyltransferase [archaeon GW2011_AR17]|nr:MAG: Phosphatidate cytidylyltransferase [archaeon GW2011_AR17]MBS3154602.1 hypothetical protein [Candidatus Woesearchaeota archaeon]HIH14739.1 hypothetical protein [Nanoarchaeota archaeon]HIH58517.1 hypothetical protein [Nanoarchaeota archaeon]HII14286.1 hypothetical protein [Nanoarchaeota archaeon]
MISALELRRQFLHMAFGIFLVTMLYFHFFNIYHLIGILILGLIFSRLCKSYTIPLASWVMEKFERPENRKTFPGKGPIFFTIGSIIVVYFFPLKIALASIIILTLGDALSHIFGKLLSRKTYKYLKSVEGTIAGIAFSFFGALLFVNVFAALSGSLLSMVLETLKLDYIDDNLLVPVTAALIMSIF